MPNKVAVDKPTKKALEQLGKHLAKCRGDRSLRKISEPCGISASHLLSIENGTLAPTADVYAKLLTMLSPTDKQRANMDHLFMAIRKTPPPDVCNVIINCPGLIPALRSVEGVTLTEQQIDSISDLLASFAQENTKGDIDNG